MHLSTTIDKRKEKKEIKENLTKMCNKRHIKNLPIHQRVDNNSEVTIVQSMGMSIYEANIYSIEKSKIEVRPYTDFVFNNDFYIRYK